MNTFRDKYCVPSARWQQWNYGWNGACFVTICTHEWRCLFGEIIDDIMVLSEIGEIAKRECLKTFEMRFDMKLTLGEYVITPHHFHGIITIVDNPANWLKDDYHDQ